MTFLHSPDKFRSAPTQHPGRYVATVLGLAAFSCGTYAQQAPMPADACEKLAQLKLPNTTITMAKVVPPGEFQMPRPQGAQGPGPGRGAPGNVPGGGGPGGGKPPVIDGAFCRVSATLKPSSDSDIKMEVWLPTSGWNKKFEVPGNSGFGGSIQFRGMIEGLTSGYAVASNDTGHDQPECIHSRPS